MAPGEIVAPEDVTEARARLARLQGLIGKLGYDGLLVADDGDPIWPWAGNVRWLSNLWFPMPIGEKLTLAVVVPAEGDPIAVVPPGPLGMHAHLARRVGWIDRVLSTFPEDPVEQMRVAGSMGPRDAMAVDVAGALAELGLDTGSVGLCGALPGIERLRAELPKAEIEPAWVDDAGTQRDPVELLRVQKSAWELERLRRAQQCAIEAGRAVARLLADGASYEMLVAEGAYRGTLAGSEQTLHAIGVGAEPWQFFTVAGTHRAGRFRDGDLVTYEFNAVYEGYNSQSPRSWVVGGKPSARQQRMLDTARRAYDATVAALRPGVTGGELWDVCVGTLEEAGYTAFVRQGHGLGMDSTERLNLYPGCATAVRDGQAVMVHPAPFDRETGEALCIGDHFLVTTDGAEPLCDSILPHDLSPAAA